MKLANHIQQILSLNLVMPYIRCKLNPGTDPKKGKYTFPIESHRAKSVTHQHYHCDIYAFVFFPDKRILFIPNSSGQKYFVYQEAAIVDNMEFDSLQETLGSLNQMPVIDNIIK